MNAAAIERARFLTHDVEEGEYYVRQMYVGSRLRVTGADAEFEFFSDLLLFGGLFAGRTRTMIAATVDSADGVEQLTISASRRPMRVGPAGRQHSLAEDEAVCVPPRIPYQANWDSLEADAVSFGPGLLDDVAAAQLEPGQALRFEFDRAISPIAADTWRHTFRLVQGVAAANAAKASNVLLADELTRLLASAALTCFPNTTMTDANVQPTRTAPESLRRAVAFIESNLDRPITLADLATAARVSPRALNVTFQRHYDTSPMGYVRRARLDRAHQDLKNAQPGDGESVTGIAARWGFYSLPRFGVVYRQTYGQPPSRTLRQG